MSQRPVKSAARRPRRVSLRLEPLEDRSTPTILTTTTVTVSPNPIQIGKTLDVMIRVEEVGFGDGTYDPEGVVRLFLNDTALGYTELVPSTYNRGMGLAPISISTATFPAGDHSFRAVYEGETGYQTAGHDPSEGSARLRLSTEPVDASQSARPWDSVPIVPGAGTGVRVTAVGADAGVPASVSFTQVNGPRRFPQGLTPYGDAFKGGVRIAVSDLTGDGVPDIVTVPGPGLPVQVIVFDGVDDSIVWQAEAFEPSFTGGAFVSAGDIDGDGRADVAVSPDEAGGPRVRIFRGDGSGQLADFFGIDDPAFRGGARTAIGDFDGDGRGDLAVAAGFGGGPRVAVFDGKSLAGGSFTAKLRPDYFAFEATLRNGVYLAAGDVAGGPADELLVGGGPGGGPRVRALEAGDPNRPVADFFAGDPAERGGVRLSVGDLNGDGLNEIFAGTGAGTAGLGTNGWYRPDGTLAEGRDSRYGGVFVGTSSGAVRVTGASGAEATSDTIDVAGHFIPGVPTVVVFSDQNGYRVEVPAQAVSADRVRVALPAYTDPRTGAGAARTLTTAVVQTPPGRAAISSGTFDQYVAALPATGPTPGTLSRSVLAAARDTILASIYDLEYVAQYSGASFDSDGLLEEAYRQLDELDEQIARLDEAPAGGNQPVIEGYGPGGVPLWTPNSVPDRAISDAALGTAAEDRATLDSALRQVLDNYNRAGAAAFERGGRDVFAWTGRVPPAVIGVAGAGFIRRGTTDILMNNLPADQVQRIWPQGKAPTTVQSDPNAGRTPQTNAIFGTWRATKNYGTYKLTFTLVIGPNGATATVGDTRNTQTEIGSGSTARVTLSGNTVSGDVQGSWTRWDYAAGGTSNVYITERRTVPFEGTLTAQGQLSGSINYEPVLFTRG